MRTKDPSRHFSDGEFGRVLRILGVSISVSSKGT